MKKYLSLTALLVLALFMMVSCATKALTEPVVVEEAKTLDSSVKDIQKYYNTLLYSFYNIYGERIKSMLVSFDFDNSTITVNGNTLKVVEDSDFVYKVLKTKVKAIDGIKGLYKHILEAMHVESPFNCATWNILAKIGNIEE